MILLCILIVFFLAYAFLIGYYWHGWNLAKIFPLQPNEEKTFISVIVAARNEEKHIIALLNALAIQTYPQEFFEIIISDDFSTDATAELVKAYSSENLFLIQPDSIPELSSKKKAIASGIHKAKGTLIVTTDADCIPPVNWLASINDLFCRSNACFIAAPVKLIHDQSLLQVFQSLDFLTLQGITAAGVATRFHAMCNGANLAYKKQSFIEVNGFEGIDKIATGDDMLLMQKIWKKDPGKVFYLKDKEAIVRTQAMASWKELIMQRKRWASKSLVYEDSRIKAVLGFVYVLNCLFIVTLTASFFHPFYWWLVLGFLLIKTTIEFPFLYVVSKFYDEQKLIKWFLFLQPLHIFYTVTIGLISQFGKYEWKGRRTR